MEKIITWEIPTNEPITIYPIGDTHIGSPEFDNKAWENFIEYISKTKNAYVLIVGDMLNNGLKNSVTNVYDEVLKPSKQMAYLAETLQPIKDKIICGSCGNHEYRSVKEVDNDPLRMVFESLGIEDRYRTNICYTSIQVGDKNYDNGVLKNSKDRPVYVIASTHGSGGGQFVSTSGGKAEKFSHGFEGVDLFISGHTHKPFMFPTSRTVIDVRNKTVKCKTMGVCIASSWLSYGGYPVRGMLPSTAQMLEKIELSCHGKKIKMSGEWEC